jgi:alanyl-tRNA synthetase
MPTRLAFQVDLVVCLAHHAEPFLFDLFPALVNWMGQQYPKLETASQAIGDILTQVLANYHVMSQLD